MLFLLSQIDKKIVRTEIGVLLRLSHPNIVSMFIITALMNNFEIHMIYLKLS